MDEPASVLAVGDPLEPGGLVGVEGAALLGRHRFQRLSLPPLSSLLLFQPDLWISTTKVGSILFFQT